MVRDTTTLAVGHGDSIDIKTHGNFCDIAAENIEEFYDTVGIVLDVHEVTAAGSKVVELTEGLDKDYRVITWVRECDIRGNASVDDYTKVESFETDDKPDIVEIVNEE
jgi:hypothetical protein